MLNNLSGPVTCGPADIGYQCIVKLRSSQKKRMESTHRRSTHASNGDQQEQQTGLGQSRVRHLACTTGEEYSTDLFAWYLVVRFPLGAAPFCRGVPCPEAPSATTHDEEPNRQRSPTRSREGHFRLNFTGENLRGTKPGVMLVASRGNWFRAERARSSVQERTGVR